MTTYDGTPQKTGSSLVAVIDLNSRQHFCKWHLDKTTKSFQACSSDHV